jgi:CO dehydrogenase maturation factor
MKSTTIAISGKGGSGKSTMAALMIRWLNSHGYKSVLAVDADPNVNLNELLGVTAGEAVGAIREEMKEKVSHLPGGMTKQQFLEYKIHGSLVETGNFDLITMGRPEGLGCYCYANSLLRDILKTLSENYEYVVIDNEAGMEHLSRRSTQKIDCLLILADPSVRGIRTAGRISRLVKELDTRVGHKYLVVNRTRDKIPSAVRKQIDAEGLQLLTTLPEDDAVWKHDAEGKPVYGMSATSALYSAVDGFMSKLLAEM